MGLGLYAAIIASLILIFSLAIPASAFDFNPLPAANVKTIPTENDFLTKTRTELLSDYDHAVLTRENGESIYFYLLYTDERNTKPVMIFYFEDSTIVSLENYYTDFNSDFLFLYFSTTSGTDERFAFAESNEETGCIVPMEHHDDFLSGTYSGCEGGASLTKPIQDGWAAYVKFFDEISPPSNENPYHIKWAYWDLEEEKDNVPTKESFSFWPKNLMTYATVFPTIDEQTDTVLVNNGKVSHTEFLFKPWELLTNGLEPNEFPCADNTIAVTADQENYSKKDVANFKAKIYSDIYPQTIYLKIYDYAYNLVFSSTANFNGKDDVKFLVGLKDFEQGLYTAVAKFGIDGPKAETKFRIGQLPIPEQIGAQCYFYALYDSNSRELSLLFNLDDGSYSELDKLQIFLDSNGNGGSEPQSDDFTIIIDKERFGGLKYKADVGWQTYEEHEMPGNARIKQLTNKYPALVKIPNISNDFRIATEQTDYNNFDLKKSRFSNSSFSTIPNSWLKTEFTDASIQKMKSDKWIPDEIVLKQQIDVNLIMIGDEWDSNLESKVRNNLEKKYLPVILKENSRAGIQYDYSYDFISASEQQSNDLFNLMKTENEHLRPFYGGGEFDDPWGIAVWIRNNHTEWANEIQTRYEVDYKLIDAEMVEDFLYENIIANDGKLSKSNSVNLVFISDDMNDVDFLHNYKLKRADRATDQPHNAIGLMGYGGNYNLYYFDLYAYPWENFQGFEFAYDYEMKHHFKNFHDMVDDDERAELISDYVNNATALIVTPSYLYAPVYKDKYILDLVIVGKTTAATNVLLGQYIDLEKIESELEGIVPYSDWEIQVTLENIRSRNLPNELKKELQFTENVPLYDFPGAPIIDIVDSEQVSKQLVTWASSRTSGDIKDYTKIKDSSWTITALIVIGERENPVYILVDEFLASGLAPSDPDNPIQPCCVLGVTYDKAVWDDEVSVTDLVIHEVGHALGFLHPFQGFDEKGKFFWNDYFNWYLSPMTYSDPPTGCGFWYLVYVEGSCGISDAKFTKFEKDNHARGVTSYLVQAALIDVYRTMIILEESGEDVNNPPTDVKNSLNMINSELDKAESSFSKNDLTSSNGAISHAYAAAVEASELAKSFGVKLKPQIETQVELKIPEWIKDNAAWWASDAISQSDFVNSIQYLIKQRIIVIPDLPESGIASGETVPGWVKNTARWWANDEISNNEFVNAIQYLVKQGIIRV